MDEPFVVPQLNAGPHFLLRAWTLDDVEVLEEAAQDAYIPLVTSVPSTYSPAEGVAFVERQWCRASARTGYSFAIVRASHGRAVGQIGLWPTAHGRASVGYWIVASARGQGAAREALRTLSMWGLQELGIPRIELHVEPWNTASWKTAEHVGYQREGLLRSWHEIGGTRRDMYVYSMLPEDSGNGETRSLN